MRRDAILGVLFTSALIVAVSPGQMEKRATGNYAAPRFERMAPAVGTQAFELALCDLDGRPWSTAGFLGRTVVLLKAAYT